MAHDDLTPSRKQYLKLKSKHPDDILLMRMGDFYECFDDDARLVTRELDIVLTSRPNGKGPRIPMAGVPYHAAESYIGRLVAKGHKVALCEQIGDSATTKGLMERQVVRVFTAGTIIEPGMLDAGRNNYLVAIWFDEERAGLAYADITTGQFAVTTLPNRRALVEELARLEPSELLLADGEYRISKEEARAKAISKLPPWHFEVGQARLLLEKHFAMRDLTALGIEQKPLAISAAGAVLYYLQETQKGAVDQIQRLAYYQTDKFMALGLSTRRNLELTESLGGDRGNSLYGVLNKTVTPMGARLLRERVTRPLLDLDHLTERLDYVQSFVQDGLLRAEARTLLKGLPDLERLVNRVVSGRATPRDVSQIGQALLEVPAIQRLFGNVAAGGAPLADLASQLDPCPEVASVIGRALGDDAPNHLNKPDFILPGYSAELDGVLNSAKHARDWVANLEPHERERSGINTLKVGFNQVFGYYIEVSRAQSDNVPEDYIRKQTLTNAERYITPELKEYETLILNAEERILQIERRLFEELCQEIGRYAARLLFTADILAQLDVAGGLAEVAANYGYVRPTLTHLNVLDIRGGRHPVIERTLELERFVPNDTYFDEKERIHLITGPNMAGKSTVLRQVALIVLMAQMGSFVPADSAEIGLVDRIFTRIGAHDELHAGRSTFMVEMVEAAEILHHASHRSLLILDEIGRGTSTYDGLSIAWAMAEYLHNNPRLRPRTLFATHYHELTHLMDLFPMVVNYNVAVAEEGERVIFLHQLVRGGADKSYGIHVAQLAGLPREVIQRAQQVMETLERQAPSHSAPKGHLRPVQQAALFPEASPILQEIAALDVASLTPLEAISKLFEWKQKYGE